jgi:hypothetical protein
MPQLNRTVSLAVLSACVCLTLSGCIIWPATEVLYPEISGTLRTRAGAPLRGIQVDRCTPVAGASAVTTDSAGAFALPGSTKRRWITGLIGDRLLFTCFRTVDGGRTREWRRKSWGDLPRQLKLRCTIDQAVLECFDEN